MVEISVVQPQRIKREKLKLMTWYGQIGYAPVQKILYAPRVQVVHACTRSGILGYIIGYDS